ncbi:hypothetical protein HWV62_27321 [Athelia sp. TMB]|nr:hypothetical protein HWV62_27321 [Athelia sp. TMB]
MFVARGGREREPPYILLHALGEAGRGSGTALARSARLVRFLLVVPDEDDLRKQDDVHDSKIGLALSMGGEGTLLGSGVFRWLSVRFASAFYACPDSRGGGTPDMPAGRSSSMMSVMRLPLPVRVEERQTAILTDIRVDRRGSELVRGVYMMSWG